MGLATLAKTCPCQIYMVCTVMAYLACAHTCLNLYTCIGARIKLIYACLYSLYAILDYVPVFALCQTVDTVGMNLSASFN